METKATLTSSLGQTVLGNGILTIGRAVDSGLVISDAKVSRHHAEIRPSEQGYTIVDLGSANGTIVNGERLIANVPRLLHSGDTFHIGDFTFTYEEEYPTSDDQTQQTMSNPWAAQQKQAAANPWANQQSQSQEANPWATQQSVNPWGGQEPSAPSQEAWNQPQQSWGQSGTSALSPLQQGTPSYGDPAPVSAWSGPPSRLEGVPELSQSPSSSSPGWQQQQPSFGQPGNMGGESIKPAQEEYLQFAAFHPRTVPVETWNTLLVYAYIESALQAVRADAYQFREQLGPDPFRADAWASHPLPRGAPITVVPTFQGVVFNPERIVFTWEKDWHRAIFSFGADKRWVGAVNTGEITIFAGPLIIASLKISLRFSEQSLQNNRNQEEVLVSCYRKIFTSYSHIDTPIVSAIRKAYKAIGDDTFLDIENLRSGQYWNPALMRMIDDADVFQLFWSKNSAQSQYVYQECQYALQHYKYEGFIRPVYWEKPMEAPPVTLSHLHFAYYELSPMAMTDKKDSLLSRFLNIFRRK